MTRTDRAVRKIEERLTAGPKPVPPPQLLQQIVDEIPEDLAADDAGRGPSTPWWKLAAAVVLLLGGGLLARQMMHRTSTVGEFVEQEMGGARPQRSEAALEGATARSRRPAGGGDVPEVSEEWRPSDSGAGEETPEPPARSLATVDEPARVPAAPAPTPAEAPKAGERVESALYVQVSETGGAVLPGATLTLQGAGGSRVQVTSPAGQARFLGLRPGLWKLTCELEGYSTVTYPNLEIWRGHDRKVQIVLAEAAEEVISVTSESPLVDERRVGDRKAEGQSSAETPPRRTELRLEIAPEAPLLMQAPAYRRTAPAPPSTGGTAEPNDQAYGDMFFGSYGENPFIDTEDDALSTFGLDVDTGSWTLVRSYLDRGSLPPRDAVRVEELVNAFDYGDPAPRRGDFSLVAEGARTPYGESADYYLLRFGLSARDVLRRERPPVTLVFTVDTSGSMAREDRLGLVKRSLELLVEELGPRDEVGLVTFGSRARVVLEPTSDRDAVLRSLAWLRPEGSTNAEQGLRVAYDLMQSYRRDGALHRVILCSDGVANVGATGPGSILESIGRWAREGVELTTIGFGMGNYNDLLMEQLADRGDGRYHYVDTLDEARRVFVDDLAGTLVTVAEEARVQVEFDPDVVERYRLLGYENRDIADRDFRNDRVDAGEIGAGHHVTALYEVKLRDRVRSRDVVATLRLRYRSAETGRWEELVQELTAGELAERWERAPRSLRLAGTVAELAELLKGTYWAREGDLGEIAREAGELAREWRGDAEVAELARLARRAAEIDRGRTPPPEED